MKDKKLLKIIAIATAIAGVAVAVGVFLKKKSSAITEELDFDNTMYFDDDELFSQPKNQNEETANTEAMQEPVTDIPDYIFEEVETSLD